MIHEDRRGDVPVFAVFAIFTILITGTALVHFRTASRQEASTIRMLTAIDIVRARSSAIESDLNDTLDTAITAAMREVGLGGGTRKNVETRVRDYLNARIGRGWNYVSVSEDIPRVDENNLRFEWRPDGSVIVHGLLPASIKHVNGPTAYGIRLYSVSSPRFERLKYVAERVAKQAENEDLDELERKLNENYAAEGLHITLTLSPDNAIEVRVEDTFGAKAVIG